MCAGRFCRARGILGAGCLVRAIFAMRSLGCLLGSFALFSSGSFMRLYLRRALMRLFIIKLMANLLNLPFTWISFLINYHFIEQFYQILSACFPSRKSF
jgi:hypothetical protein